MQDTRRKLESLEESREMGSEQSHELHKNASDAAAKIEVSHFHLCRILHLDPLGLEFSLQRPCYISQLFEPTKSITFIPPKCLHGYMLYLEL